MGHSSRFIASGGQLGLLSGLQHAGDLGEHAEVANYLADVSRLAAFSELVPEDDVDGPRHCSRRNLGGILLDSDLLEVCKSALRHLQLPRVPIAIFSSAPLRLCVLELLDNILANLAAGPAFEHSDLQLRPNLRCPCHCSF